jgi:hypothetical protein
VQCLDRHDLGIAADGIDSPTQRQLGRPRAACILTLPALGESGISPGRGQESSWLRRPSRPDARHHTARSRTTAAPSLSRVGGPEASRSNASRTWLRRSGQSTSTKASCQHRAGERTDLPRCARSCRRADESSGPDCLRKIRGRRRRRTYREDVPSEDPLFRCFCSVSARLRCSS